VNRATYEDAFSPVGRRLRRVMRGLRWTSKAVTGGRRRLLVEMRWRLGDEVMALPIYRALRECHPACHMTVLCNFPDLLLDNPDINVVNRVSVRPDRYILLRGARRDEPRLEVYARKAGVPVPISPPQLCYRDWQSPVLEKLPRKVPLVAVSRGASWPTKRWGLERWRALCSELVEDGYGVVQLGRGNECIGVGTCLVGQTTVRDAACVLRAVKLLVCCDSGLMHLALAVGVPVVALFGPTDPSIIVRDDARLTIIGNGRDCQGCWNRREMDVTEGECPLEEPNCLETIDVDTVLARARERMRRG